jgi:hypothetical protein
VANFPGRGPVTDGRLSCTYHDIMPRDSSDAQDLRSEIELSIRLLEEAVAGGAQDNIERCTQMAEAIRERVNGFLMASKASQEERALLNEGLKRLELTLNAVNSGRRTRSAHAE